LAVLGASLGTADRTTRAEASAPASGALFGVFPGYNPGHAANAWSGPDLYTYIPQMNRWQGRPSGIINSFGNISDVNNMFLPGRYFTTIWNIHHAVPMYSVVETQNDLQQIKDGALDSAMRQTRDQLYTWINGTDSTGAAAPAGGRRVFFRLLVEPNTYNLYTNYSPAALATDCADLLAKEQLFKEVWRKMRDAIMKDDNGNTIFTPNQVQWIFNVLDTDYPKPGMENCANGASDITANIYPGDDVVDWVGVDGLGIQNTLNNSGDLRPSELFGPMVAKLGTIAPTKPIGFQEVGESTTYDTNVVAKTAAWKDQWLKDYFDFMASHNIRMSVWNNIVHTPVDWAVFTPGDGEELTGETPVGGVDYLQSRGTERYTDSQIPLTYNAYKEYRLGVNRPYFTAPDASDPRLISDDVFRGTW
jgi:hypothetical protein